MYDIINKLVAEPTLELLDNKQNNVEDLEEYYTTAESMLDSPIPELPYLGSATTSLFAITASRRRVDSLSATSPPASLSAIAAGLPSRLRRPTRQFNGQKPKVSAYADLYEILDDNNNNNIEETEDIEEKEKGEGDSNTGKGQKNDRRSRPLRPKVEARRPTATTSYYSTSKEVRDNTSQAAGSAKRRVLLLYVGRIKETSVGKARRLVCVRCVAKGFIYRVYTTAGTEQFVGKKGSNNLIYGRYRYSGKQSECL